VNTSGDSNHQLDTPKGVAEVILTNGQNVTLHAPFPSPPGSPLEGVLQGTQFTLRIKVHGCRRIALCVQSDATAPPDCFEITGRWVSLSREARQAVMGPRASI